MNDDRESMTEAVKLAGLQAAQKAASDTAKKRAQVEQLVRDPMNVRLAAIDLAQRAAAGKQWTPEQYQAATEFYYGFITADSPKTRRRS